jgi:hypothetical protein
VAIKVLLKTACFSFERAESRRGSNCSAALARYTASGLQVYSYGGGKLPPHDNRGAAGSPQAGGRVSIGLGVIDSIQDREILAHSNQRAALGIGGHPSRGGETKRARGARAVQAHVPSVTGSMVR